VVYSLLDDLRLRVRARWHRHTRAAGPEQLPRAA